MIPLEARTKKGDKFFAEGRAHEAKKEWDLALESYEQALAEDLGYVAYQIPVERTGFQVSQAHVDAGLQIRRQGPARRGPGGVSEGVRDQSRVGDCGSGDPGDPGNHARERKRVETTGRKQRPKSC